jgi:D-inositol-3-phosphate glycosyltransferase
MEEMLAEYCRQKFASLGNLIRWIPGLARRDLVEHYRNADVVVLPSLCDSFGQSVLEAMACGTTCIVTDACGVPVKNGHDGVVVASDQIEAFANAFEVLATDSSSLASLGVAAATTARAYGWDRYRVQMIQLLRASMEVNPRLLGSLASDGKTDWTHD